MNPDSDLTTDLELEKELVNPPRQFAGKDLWPWSHFARLVWNMVCDDSKDLVFFQHMAALYVLQKRGGGSAKEDITNNVLRRVYDDLLALRADILSWRDEMSDEEAGKAGELVKAIWEAEEKSRVQIRPEGGQKKT